MNLHDNQEVETGFAVGTATDAVPAVACAFDDGVPLVASGTTAWTCPLPTTWRLGSRHVVTAGIWNGVSLSSPIQVTVYAAHNHDFNGDGYPDLAIGTPYASSYDGGVSIFYGSPSGITSASDLTIPAPSTASMFGFALAAADLRGTGYADLVVGLASYGASPADTGHLYVFNGGSGGLSAAASYSLAAPTLAGSSAHYSLAVGDYSGDGRDDVIVGFGGYGTPAGDVFLYKGASAGAAFDTTMHIANGAAYGLDVGVADLYGTGFAAVLVSRMDGTEMHVASSSGVATTAAANLPEHGPLNTLFTRRDGYADVAITGNARATIYYGSAAGPNRSTTSYGDAQTTNTNVIAGDLDLDGHDDIVYSTPCAGASFCATIGVSVFDGSDAGIATTSSLTLTNPGACQQYGFALGLVDLNGDGHLDLEASSSCPLVYGYAGGAATLFPSSPTTTITGLSAAVFPGR